jgi:hypothetical protein
MASVESLCVDLPDVFECSAQLRVWAPNEQVIVIRHQTVRVYLDAEATNSLSHYVKEQPAIIVVKEYELVVGSAIHHMVHSTVEIDSKWSCHWKIALSSSQGQICRDVHPQGVTRLGSDHTVPL